MSTEDPVLNRMQTLVAAWEQAGDRRSIFLSCYVLMTGNVLAAIETGEFNDNPWVDSLLKRFAYYYFSALEAYEGEQSAPVVWQLAFAAARKPQSHVLQDLILGINAHINYDLVFALSDQLGPDWSSLTPEQQKSRYHDHCRINLIIDHTINSVQDQVVDRFAPIMGLVDKALGPLDEWVTEAFIADWREEVWKHALELVQAADEAEREALRHKVEKQAIGRAHSLLGEEGLTGLLGLV